MDESFTDQLINTDLSALSDAEMLAHLDVVEQHMRNLQRTELALLEDNPQIVAQRPDLQDRRDYLRTLGLEEVSGPGS